MPDKPKMPRKYPVLFDDLCKEMNVEADRLLIQVNSVLAKGQFRKMFGELRLTEEAADMLRQAEEAPFTVPKRHQAIGIHPAGNPRYMFCTVEGYSGKVPVVIPNKLRGRLTGKHFYVHAIEDTSGTTFRHEQLAT